jgi:hypothetical protein
MSSQNNPPETPRRSLYSRHRFAFRFIGLAIAAAAAVFLYRGIRAHFVLPECDSQTAKQTLAQVLKELRLEPVRYAPIKTISSTKDKVVCNAVMPLPDGATVVADYTFSWQAGRPNMRYSIRRAPAQSSSRGNPVPAARRAS